MAKTHDFGPAFVQSIRIKKDTPRFHRAPTQETDEPFRRSHSLIVRLWGEFALVFGWWRDSGMAETEALLSALKLGDETARLYDDVYARRTVAKHSIDIDDEWKNLQMLGLDA